MKDPDTAFTKTLLQVLCNRGSGRSLHKDPLSGLYKQRLQILLPKGSSSRFF
jgi:hypothetical protein